MFQLLDGLDDWCFYAGQNENDTLIVLILTAYEEGLCLFLLL